MWDGPFEVLGKINPNSYKVDLPGEYGVSTTFNVSDLSLYLDEDDELPSLRANAFQVERDDGDQVPKLPKPRKLRRCSN